MRYFVMQNERSYHENSVTGTPEIVDPYVRIVANRFLITSRHDDSVQYVWESCTEQSITIYGDVDRGERGRGIKLVVHHEGDATEFLDGSKLDDLIKTYPRFKSNGAVQL